MKALLALFSLAVAQFTYDNATSQLVELSPGFLLSWDWYADAIAFKLNLGAPVYSAFQWVGVGVNGNGTMKGADLYTVVKANGNFYLADRMGVGLVYPPTDESQGGSNDLQLLDFLDDGSNVTISFRRPLDSGDASDIVIAPNRQYSVLFAWGGASGELINYHGQNQRGSKLVNFTIAPAVLSTSALLAVFSWLLIA